MDKLINYQYRYCTESMISDAISETGLKYPEIMELIEYIEVENDEDKYVLHGLEQDWDSWYFLRDKNGLA